MLDTVLVVDDERGTRTALRIMLQLEGYAVTEAANGREALQRVQEQRPAVVLLDLRMPVMDGRRCCEELRATQPELPVVLMTAAYQAREEASSCGATGCLSKPFDVDAVLDTVARYVPSPQM